MYTKCYAKKTVIIILTVLIFFTQAMIPAKASESDSNEKVIYFSDVSTDSPYYVSSYWAIQNGIITKIGKNKFYPLRGMSKLEFINSLWRYAGSPEPGDTELPYSDIHEGNSGYNAVKWAYGRNIIKGSSLFNGDSFLKRKSAAQILWKYARKTAAAKITLVTDMLSSDSFYNAVQWALSYKIMKLYTGKKFKPDEVLTRDAASYIFYRMSKLSGKCSLKKASVSADVENCYYTGDANKPKVTVIQGGITLKKGIDYSVKYTDNILPGEATVIISGKGAYSGQQTLSFKILSEAPVMKKLSNRTDGIKVSWKETAGAVKYRVYRSTNKGKTWKSLGTTKETSFKDKKVVAGGQYTYTVKAIDKNGNQSGYDEKGKTITLPKTYSDSSLVDYTLISPNKDVDRNHVIDTITIHMVWGQCSVETLGDIFYPESRQASSNYGIGYDGRIGQYCNEKDRSWCSSSSANDNRAITIEVANDRFEPYAVNKAAYKSLIKLVTDICIRNNIKELRWKNDPNLIGKVNKQNMTVHRWFAATNCPGTWLMEHMGEIAEKVNKNLSKSKKVPLS